MLFSSSAMCQKKWIGENRPESNTAAEAWFATAVATLPDIISLRFTK